MVLPIPTPVESNNHAVELLRVWNASGRQHFSIATEVWDDPAAWGLLLADLARNIANTYERQDLGDVIDRIRKGFEVELDHPT